MVDNINNTETEEIVESDNDTDKIEVTPALTTRRIAAALIDFFCVIAVFLVVIQAAFPIGSNIVNYPALYEQYIELLDSSNLYVYQQTGEEQGTEGTEDYLEVRNFYAEKKESDPWGYIYKLDEHLTVFYGLTDIFSDLDINTYTKSKVDSGLFVVENDVPISHKETATIEELTKFYENEVDTALVLWSHDENVLNVSRKITNFSVIVFVISLMIPMFIFYLLLPMLLKNRNTLGKKFTGLGVVSRKNGLLASRLQMFIRFLVLLLIEVGLSIMLSGLPIPLLVSLTMVCLSKTGNSIHDYFAATLVVDTRDCPIYSSIEEYTKSLETTSDDISLVTK